MSSPKVRCHDRAGSPSRADDPDRPRPLHDDPIALSICAQHPIAAGLVVGPDDVRDVGVGNERYDAVLSSGNGVGSEVDGGHYKSSCGSRFHLRTSGPGPSESLSICAHSAPARDETVRPSVGQELRAQGQVGDYVKPFHRIA